MDDEGLVNYFNPCDLKIGVEKDVPAWWYHMEGEREKKRKKSKAVVDGMDDGKA